MKLYDVNNMAVHIFVSMSIFSLIGVNVSSTLQTFVTIINLDFALNLAFHVIF